MSAADLLVSVIILVGPVWEHRVGLPRLRAQLASGAPGVLARGYNQIMLQQWGLTALALQSMTVQLAYDQLVYREQPQDVDALVDAVVPIWAKAVGLYRWLSKS